MDIPVFEHISPDACTGCELCACVCEMKAITMVEDASGFRYPMLNAQKCVNCGVCVKRCPKLAPESLVENIETIAGYARSEDVVQASSSGGFFGLIATALIQTNHWTIVGVEWQDEFKNVGHICVDSLENLTRIQRSKYFQSYKKGIYRDVLKLLREGKQVLFCGCPCEVAAVKEYVPDALREGLYTIDLICQGPTSICTWLEYRKKVMERFHAEIVDVNMRYAIGPWIPQYLRITFQNGRIFCKRLYSTQLGDAIRIMQRPSCFECSFAGVHSWADLTLGDYHGANPQASYYHESGVSIAVAHTDKGQWLLQTLRGCDVYTESADYDMLAEKNPRMIKPWLPRPGYDDFVRVMRSSGLTAASRAAVPIKSRILRRMPVLLVRLLKRL